MAEARTSPGKASVREFIDGIAGDERRRECRAIMKIMKDVTGKRPVMWGPAIVGYGKYTYTYASGRTGDWFLCGFSPRKQNLTLYLMSDLAAHAGLLKKLGSHKTGKSCLYIKSLDDLDHDVLHELIVRSVEEVERTGGAC